MILSDTKGGREMEVAFIPQKIADRLKEYIQTAQIDSESKIFPISHTAAWSIVVKAGKQKPNMPVAYTSILAES